MKNLDREKEPYYSLIVKASSNRYWSARKAMRAERIQSFDPSTDSTLQEVKIYLEDINDQPPRFTKTEYTAGNKLAINVLKCNFVRFPLYIYFFNHIIYFSLGVATDAKVGSELIKVLALDADVGNNSLVFYSILGIQYIKQNSNDSKAVKNIFVIGKGIYFILLYLTTLNWENLYFMFITCCHSHSHSFFLKCLVFPFK